MASSLGLYWERIRTSYWFIPGLIVAICAGFALALPGIDDRFDTAGALGFVFTGSSQGARSLLGAVATAVLPVAGTTFTITIAVLSLTSQQYGSYLLRNFMKDTGSQVVLGTFIGTFVYALLVMRTIRDPDEDKFVPNLGVTGGVALAVLSVAMLVFFVHRISTAIQASRIVADVSDELGAVIDRLYPVEIGEGSPAPDPPWTWPASPAPCEVLATDSGYLQGVDGDTLMRLAVREGRVVELLYRPGDFVIAGLPLYRIAGPPPEDALAHRIAAALELGEHPTPPQDVSFPIRQLGEMAVRALSTGINDPETAALALDRLTVALCALIRREFPSTWRRDDSGRVRVIAPARSFEELLALAFDEIRRHARNDPAVLCRLLHALGAIGRCALTADRRDAVRRQIELVRAQAQDAPLPGEAMQQVGAARLRALQQCGIEVQPPPGG
ncbi:MAG TPA: DUF2254 domain-containing protein [Burkholderiaceae bacterium]|nr:DUF2254 domain-containing protein [Burkholderiaceae bacterium]